jgi:Protein of unknown function (DUF664)
MDVRDLLEDLLGRLDDHVPTVVDGLSAEQLAQAPAVGANSIGWLVWHLTRVQDVYVAELFGGDEVWTSGRWPARFGLAADPDNTGYGHTPEEVAQVRPDGTDALLGYYDAVRARTREVLATLEPTALDRIVDRRWNPPVTLGARVVSIADDSLQHVGQAAYVRGLLERG